MPVSPLFRVAKGGFTTLAGEVDHVARAAIADIRRKFIRKAGDTMTGQLAFDPAGTYPGTGRAIDMNSLQIVELPDPSLATEPVPFGFADTRYVEAAGDTMTGDLNMGGNAIDEAILEAQRGFNETLNDDQAVEIDFDGQVVGGLLILTGNLGGAGHAIVVFRTDGSAFATKLASQIAAGNVTTLTGALNGMTGADGDLTISAATGQSALFIENRTGATRSYRFQFLNLSPSVTTLTFT